MTVIRLVGNDEVRPGIYDRKILVPNSRELSYIRECLATWGAFGSSREDWKFKRGRARLGYRAVNQVLR